MLELSPDTLLPLIGTPYAPRLLDFTLDEDFALDPTLIPGAQRVALADLEHLSLPRDQLIVTICQRGKKISHGAAAVLRSKGHQAQALAGGNVLWRERGLPRHAWIERSKAWVCPTRPDVEQLATLWLITRILQPEPRVLFVPLAECAAVADRFSATCVPANFRAFRKEIDLDLANFSSLLDTLTPLCRGLTSLHKNDLALFDASLPLFDAAYSQTQLKEGEAA